MRDARWGRTCTAGAVEGGRGGEVTSTALYRLLPSSTALSYRALTRPRFQDLGVRLGDVHQSQVRQLDGAVALGRGRRVRGHPGEERALVLNGGGLVCGEDDIEACADAPVRAPLPFGRVVRGQHE